MIAPRTWMSCLAVALALVFLVTPAAPEARGQGGQPAPPGAQGGLPALEARVRALEQAVAALSDALSELGIDVQGLQQLFSDVNTALNTAQGDVATLQGQVAALEQQVAELTGGLLGSYDQLAGLPCTNALGAASTVYFVGTHKTPVCALTSTNGRFHDVGPFVVDTQTNLMWEKKTTAVGSGQNGGDLHDVDNVYFWCHATGDSTDVFCGGNATSWIGQVNAEVFAGFSDWRVPTQIELLTIVDTSVSTCGSGTPCIDPIFGPTQAFFYWSSTEIPFAAYFVTFFDGGTNFDFKIFVEYPVRAVRTGP